MRSTADHLDVIEILNRYATAVDTKQWDLLDDVYTEDASAQYRHVHCVSREEIKAHVSRHLGGVSASQHLLSNYVVQFDGDSASSTCALRAWVQGEGAHAGLTREAFGYYHDVLTRTSDGWRIAERSMELVAELGTTDVLQPEATSD